VLEAVAAAAAYRMVSLDEPLADGAGALESLGDDDAGFEHAEHRVLLRGCVAGLPAREREILRLRYYEGLTQREIASAVGISQMHVSRLLRRSVETMRDALAPAARAA